MHPSNKIGTKNESSLHRALKFTYSGKGGITETVIGDFVCDGQTKKGEIIEVQTGSFGPLKKKVTAISAEKRVRIVHPIIISRYIETLDSKGRFLRKRKSPKKGSIWDLFNNLIYAPELAAMSNVSIELAMIDLLETRINDGTGSWRRKGARIADKSILRWHGSMDLNSLKDYFMFIPFKKDENFTAKQLAEKAKISPPLAQKCLYVLSKLNLVEKTGKKVNAYVYERKKTRPIRRGHV